jgi:dTDP-4-dehydrorhamnose reductase
MKWLISGASGLLGHHFCKYLEFQDQKIIGLHNKHSIDVKSVECIQNDFTNLRKVENIILNSSPDVIVYASGLTNVDACEENEVLAKELHADIPTALAIAAKNNGSQFIFISTDHLWDGSTTLVTEETPTQPINVYARTKVLGERQILGVNPKNLIIRTNFFGRGRPWRKSLSDWIIEQLISENSLTAFTDTYFTPIDLNHLCENIMALADCKANGIYNIAGHQRVSKYAFAHYLAEHIGLRTDLIKPGKIIDANLKAPRPSDMSLSTKKIEAKLGIKMPTLTQCFECLDKNET